MKKREELVPSGKNLEWFLRRNFGLVGQYYSNEFEAVIEREQEGDEKAFDKFYEAHEDDPSAEFTKEAWDAWHRAYEMVNDLMEMGILNEEEGGKIQCGFWDNA